MDNRNNILAAINFARLAMFFDGNAEVYAANNDIEAVGRAVAWSNNYQAAAKIMEYRALNNKKPVKDLSEFYYDLRRYFMKLDDSDLMASLNELIISGVSYETDERIKNILNTFTAMVTKQVNSYLE